MSTDEALNEWERGSEYYRRTIEQIADNIDVLKLSTRDKHRLLAELRYTDSVLSVNVFVEDGDKVIVYKGYRAHHSKALGIYKGGTRYDPSVTDKDCAALALAMTIKCALMGLPLGGAKGGIQVDPRQLTRAQLDAITRSYTYALGDYIGPDTDIPAPDMGTDAATMAVIENEWSHLHSGHPGHGVVTGKPPAMGGIQGRISATGRGIALIASLEAARLGHPLGPDCAVAVQGFGNVGSISALELSERYQCRIVAISDVDCGIRNDAGIDVEVAKKYATNHKTLRGFDGGTQISGEELLALPVDLLVPAAMEDTIHEGNVESIQARLIVEGANGPITAAAHRQLLNRGITIVPDILANGGGVVVSHFETVQNKSRMPWTEDEVFAKMDRTLKGAYDSVIHAMAEYHLTDMRAGALIAAVAHIADVVAFQGSYSYGQQAA